MKTSSHGLRLRAIALFSILFFSFTCFASGIPDKRNVNIIGVNPPTATNGIPDSGLKQQNEPACGMKPSNPLHIICAFNDYRGVDNPAIGDAWEGYAYSINGGQTWFSDLLPGHPADPNGPGLSFAADPLVAVAPGVAVIAYIAANREEGGEGGLFMQHMFEVNREAGAPWVPARSPLEVSRGSAGQFIDKPFMLLHPGDPSSADVSLSASLVDGSSVSRDVPAARLFLSHTVFVGNDNNVKSKMMMSMSDDYGQSWTKTKLSESQAINQSSSTAAHGDDVCTVWRRFERNKQSDAILASCSSDRGDTWTKAIEVSVAPQFSPFDQGTTVTSFRTNSYPVIASDGNQFYAFWAQRSPFFSRVVFSRSVDGSSWSEPAIVDNIPFGHQFMPSVATARGTIQLAWYDSRDNFVQRDFVQDILGRLDGANPDGFVDDSTKVIRNKLDLRTVKITNGVVEPSVQVSQYLQGALLESFTEGQDPQPVFGPVQQLQFNFANDRIFKQGSAPFVGDYPNVAVPSFRLENRQWVSNIPAGSTNEPVDFIIAWSDNRDVRGNVWEDLVIPTVYTPASDEASASTEFEKKDDSNSQELVVEINNADSSHMATGLGDTKDDSKKADAEPDLPTGVLGECIPDSPFANRDRSRNQNVYSSIIRPGVSIQSPSATKQSSNQVGAVIQRAHVVWLSNNNDTQATYTVTIDNQPEGAPVNGRASFLQVPVAPFADDTGLVETIDVVIDANSTVARSVFITSTEANPPVNVSISDGGGVVFGTITLNPDIANPDIQNPDIQNPDIQNPDIQNAEVHNPDIQNPDIQNPDIQNPDIQNPDIQNPDIQNPDIQNPDIQNPDIQNPDIQNPDIQNPDIQNPDIQNSSFDGSDMENPDTAYNPEDPADDLTPEERAAGYTDVTYATTNNGNTTTAFNLDAFINGNTEGLKTQLIAFRSQLTESSRNCQPVTQVENQVIFNKINPDLSLLEEDSNDLIFGDGSAYIAPGETIYVTLRVWGGEPSLFEPENLGLKVESQSCNTVDKETGSLVIDCDPPEEQIGVYVPDNPPLINLPASPLILQPFNSEGLITASDLIPVTVTDDIDFDVTLLCEAASLPNASVSGVNSVNVNFNFPGALTGSIETIVTCSASDSIGNTSEASFTVSVEDLEPPTMQINSPNEIDTNFSFTANSTDYNVYYLGDVPNGGEFQTPHVSVFDLVDFNASDNLSCVPVSGSGPASFPIGNTTVVCTAGDANGNEVSDSFVVVVIDEINAPPVITVPVSPYTIVAETVVGAGTFGNDPDILVSVSDDLDTSVTLTCDAGFDSVTGENSVNLNLNFPGALGQVVDTIVTCTATDSSGNEAEESFTVSVDDTLGFTWRADFDLNNQPAPQLPGPYACLRVGVNFNPFFNQGETISIQLFDEENGPQIGSTSFTVPSTTVGFGNEAFLAGTQLTDGVGFAIISLTQANTPTFTTEGRTDVCIGGGQTGFVNGTMTKIN